MCGRQLMNVHCRTEAGKTIYVYVFARIVRNAEDPIWVRTGRNDSYSGKVYLEVNGADQNAERADANHRVSSYDWGNWSTTTYCTYNYTYP